MTGFLLLAVIILAVSLVKRGTLDIPDHLNPWAPLRIEEPPHAFTRIKLRRLSRNAELCLATLRYADMTFEPLEDRDTGLGCGFRNAVRITATSAAVGEPFSLSCPAAISLALWERHVLQPSAQQEFGANVARLEHFGSYACRPIYGREGGRLSRHATADALDLAGIVLEDGSRIRILGDWDGEDAESRFLRQIHEGACRFFDAVLGPEYNEAHRDHFHFDRGAARICR